MKIQIRSQRVIKPSVPTPHQLRNLKLSCIDQLAPPAYTSSIFYYPADGNVTISENDQRHNQLQKSLSETLTCFYPLAGRYMEASNSIDCNDQGVEYLEAKVDCKLAQFLQGEPETKLLNQFIPFPDELALTPTVLGIQINMFDCGGLAIGVCLSHKVADGFTLFSFINGWAIACRAGINEVKCPSFDMESILPARDLKRSNIPVPNDNETKMVTKRFVFNGDAISTLKANGSGVKCHPSRVEVVTALIWKGRIAVDQAKHGHLRPSLLNFSFNFRGKTTLPIPENSFGNVYKLVLARFRPNETKLEFNDMLSLIRDAKTNAAEECAKTADGDDLFLSAIKSIKEIHGELSKGEADICVSTSLCGFPYYATDFGWGNPAWVSSVHKPSEIVFMMDTKCGRGIEAYVTLEENDMLQFQKDKDIVAFTSNTELTS